jgi:hypothetical protein
MNIDMAVWFEHRAQQLSLYWPRKYFRLIDDGMFIWEAGFDALQQFIQLFEFSVHVEV